MITLINGRTGTELTDGFLDIDKGDVLNVTCSASKSSPAASLTWSVDDAQVPAKESWTTSSADNRNLFDSYSRLEIKSVDLGYHEKTIKCVATVPVGANAVVSNDILDAFGLATIRIYGTCLCVFHRDNKNSSQTFAPATIISL